MKMKALALVLLSMVLNADGVKSKTLVEIEKLEKGANVMIMPIEDYNKQQAEIQRLAKEAKEAKEKAEIQKKIDKELKAKQNTKKSFFTKEETIEAIAMSRKAEKKELEVFAINTVDNYIKSLKDVLVELEETKIDLEMLQQHGFNKTRVYNEIMAFQKSIENQITAIENQRVKL